MDIRESFFSTVEIQTDYTWSEKGILQARINNYSDDFASFKWNGIWRELPPISTKLLIPQAPFLIEASAGCAGDVKIEFKFSKNGKRRIIIDFEKPKPD